MRKKLFSDSFHDLNQDIAPEENSSTTEEESVVITEGTRRKKSYNKRFIQYRKQTTEPFGTSDTRENENLNYSMADVNGEARVKAKGKEKRKIVIEIDVNDSYDFTRTVGGRGKLKTPSFEFSKELIIRYLPGYLIYCDPL